jgi:hypothetical protein
LQGSLQGNTGGFPEHQMLSGIGAFSFINVDLLHLKHSRHGSLKFFRIVISIKMLGTTCHEKAIFVLEPAALLGFFIPAMPVAVSRYLIPEFSSNVTEKLTKDFLFNAPLFFTGRSEKK